MYRDPILKKYADLIDDNCNKFKEIYYGDPIRVPKSKLPALILEKTETRAGVISNAEDEHGIQITLTIITDIRREIGGESDLAPGISQLYELIEGRESDTLKLKTDSLLHILRNNVLVDSSSGLRTDLGSVTRVDYGMTIDKRAEGHYAIEAGIEFVASFRQLR